MNSRLFTLSFGSLLGLIGCASKQLITPQNAMNSRIEIDYRLGHSQYRYVAIGGEPTAEVSSTKDGQLIEKRNISAEKYRDFAVRLETAIRSAEQGVADENCRTPYQIQIVIENRHNTISGCRSADADGQIGQLLNEGEFLFYSEEPQDEELKEEQREEKETPSHQG